MINNNTTTPYRITIQSRVFDFLRKHFIAKDKAYSYFKDVRDMSSVFSNINSKIGNTTRREFYTGNFDFSNTVNIEQLFSHSCMFDLCGEENWDFHNVKFANSAFENCLISGIRSENWDIINLEYADSMFSSSVFLRKFNGFKKGDKLICANHMFSDCILLGRIYCPNDKWTTPSLKFANSMFSNCESLKWIYIAGLDTSNVFDMHNMFNGCKELEVIANVIDMKNCIAYDGMFEGCDKLVNVAIKNPPTDFEEKTGIKSYQYMVVN